MEEEGNPGTRVEEVKVKGGVSGRYNYVFILEPKFINNGALSDIRTEQEKKGVVIS